MGKNSTLIKTLAIAGAVLVWLPLLAPILFSILFFSRTGFIRFDYLMPAELFLSTLIGAGLLFWVGRRARLDVKLLAWGSGLAVGFLIISQGLAVVSGLASGEIEPEGIWLLLVLALLIAFILADLLVIVGSVRLLRQLFRASPPTDLPAATG